MPFSLTKPTSRLSAAAVTHPLIWQTRAGLQSKLHHHLSTMTQPQTGTNFQLHTVIGIQQTRSPLVEVRRPNSAGSQGECRLGYSHASQCRPVCDGSQASGTGSASLYSRVRTGVTDTFSHCVLSCSCTWGVMQALLVKTKEAHAAEQRKNNSTAIAPSTAVDGT